MRRIEWYQRTCLLVIASVAMSLLYRAQAQQPAPSADTQTQISHIENGLLPSVIIKGQPVAGMHVTDRMRYYHVPGVSIAYFDHGKIQWTKAYGVADVQTGRLVTPETLFQAGSISKPIAALGALSLVRSGKLKLDENVNNELRSWHIPENEFTTNQKVTLRRLLSHSAGVGVHGFSGYEVGQPLPTVIQILDGLKPAASPPVRVETVPGLVYSYSGGGMMIVQLLMMEKSGKSFPAVMRSQVLGPIGMIQSTYEQPLPSNLVSSAALGYGSHGSPLPGGFHVIPEMAAGGLWSTPSDLARAAIEVQKEYAGTSDRILTQALAKDMLSRQKDNWGLGFEVEKPGATPRFDHFGVNTGFVSVLEAYRDQGQGVVIMTNGQQGEKLITELLRSIAHEYAWPDLQPVEHTLIKLDPASLEGLEGTYDQADKDGQDKLTVTIRDGKPYISGSYSVGSTYHFGFSEPCELLPETRDQYFTLQTSAASFRFERASEGRVDRCIVISGTNQRDAKKL
ncbi:serine hydrolase [Terriglobus sp. TAA 43]|uniref:serine hydrolase domain-containing protein n=1 Tax=Terriglobus sp. TAA 43 TaxID=278961 RepID=UPI00068EDF7E|nr:serine hydrolase domain-containing protein [Terriglobus sp. TAA 43]